MNAPNTSIRHCQKPLKNNATSLKHTRCCHRTARAARLSIVVPLFCRQSAITSCQAPNTWSARQRRASTPASTSCAASKSTTSPPSARRSAVTSPTSRGTARVASTRTRLRHHRSTRCGRVFAVTARRSAAINSSRCCACVTLIWMTWRATAVT